MFFEDDACASAGELKDVPLSLAWDGITDENLQTVGLFRVRNASGLKGMIACLLIARSVDRWVSYSRNKDHYRGPRRYGDPNHTYFKITAMVDHLNALGLLDEQRARRGQYGWQSRMRASDRLLALSQNCGPFSPRPLEGIRLRDANKYPVDYADTDATQRMRDQLERHNEAIAALQLTSADRSLDLSKHAILIEGSVISPSRRRLHRVFNGDWRHGGRLYGGFWQSLPSKLRNRLRIDAEEVIEVDYQHLHPQLLYACCGASLTSDAYTIEEFDRRDCKIAFQMILNCSSRPLAVQSLLKFLRETNPAAGPADAKALLGALEQHHYRIRSTFYSVMGRGLQFIDSELLLRVMDDCLSQGITGLPIHDSLIIRKTDADRVRKIMDDQLQSTLAELSDTGFRKIVSG